MRFKSKNIVDRVLFKVHDPKPKFGVIVPFHSFPIKLQDMFIIRTCNKGILLIFFTLFKKRILLHLIYCVKQTHLYYYIKTTHYDLSL